MNEFFVKADKVRMLEFEQCNLLIPQLLPRIVSPSYCNIDDEISASRRIVPKLEQCVSLVSFYRG